MKSSKSRVLGWRGRKLVIVLAAEVAAVGIISNLPTVTAYASPAIRCAPTLGGAGGTGKHTLALNADATVRAWGNNWAGELGDGGNESYSATPVPVVGLSHVAAVVAGSDHSLAVTADGRLWAWGFNVAGELGDGGTTSRNTPEQVAGLHNVIAAAAGQDYSMALLADGTVWTWGWNGDGELGTGNNNISYVPVQVSGLTNVTDIAAGDSTAYAVTSDGGLWSWGYDSWGQLGNGTEQVNTNVPGQIMSGVVQVSAGSEHAMVLTSTGAVYTFGHNGYGQLGTGDNVTYASPVQVPGVTASAVAGGGYNSTAVLTDGTARTWGSNYEGELGNPSYTPYSNTPIQPTNLSTVSSLAAGGNHEMAVDGSGNVWTWGQNDVGQLGNGAAGSPQYSPGRIGGVGQSLPTTAPTQVGAAAGNGIAYVSWTPPPTEVVTQYIVTPYLNGVAQAPLSTGSFRGGFTVAGLTQGAAYSFTVAAQNCVGQGSASPQTARVVPTGVQLNENGFKIEGTRLNDRMVMHLNTFNGNVNLHENDVRIKGTGLDLAVDRYYNNRAPNTVGIFGRNWTTTVGGDIKLVFPGNGNIWFNGPGGYQLGFAVNSDGTYVSPSGVDATLVKNLDGTYTLTFHASTEKYNFDSTGKWTSDVDRNGNALRFTYAGPGGALSSVTDTQGRVLSFSYSGGFVSSISDWTGRTWSYFYTGNNLTKFVDPQNGPNFPTLFSYDASNNLSQVTTPGARVLHLGYNASAQLSTMDFPNQAGDPLTQFTYTPGNDYTPVRTKVTDANGHSTTYATDPVGRLEEVTDAMGNVTSMGYTSNSNVQQYQMQFGASGWGYDSVNNLTSTTAPTGAQSTMKYTDPAHPYSPTQLTDAQGNSEFLAYDVKGNLTTATDQLPAQNQVAIAYNPNGTRLSSQNATSGTTLYTYDALGNLTGIAPPSPLGSVAIGNDTLSRINSVTDGNGQNASYHYDALDRVTAVYYAGSSTGVTYDGDGNQVTLTDSTGTTTMQYDAMNRLTRRQTSDGVVVSYVYDGVGNMTQINNGGDIISYVYNPVNLANTVTDSGGTTLLGYDINYNRTSVAYPNGTRVNSTYDTSNRLTSVTAVDASSKIFDSYAYSYADQSGKDTQLRQTRWDHAGNTTVYQYDQLNRLTSATVTASSNGKHPSNLYGYDGDGNRVSQATNGGTASVNTFNAADELLTEGPGPNKHTFTFDGNGNETADTSAGGVFYQYNAQDQMTGSGADGNAAIKYTYRGFGQGERAGQGPTKAAQTTTYAYTSLGLAAQTQGAVTTNFTRDPRGELLDERVGATKLFYVLDGTGSVVDLTGVGGNVQVAYSYDPFGQQTQTLTTDGIANPFGSASAYLDPTGLYKMGARYYDPTTGRFTQQDPVVNFIDPMQWDRYVYVGDDPVNYVDLSGNDFLGCLATMAQHVNDFFKGAFSGTGGNLAAIGGAAIGVGLRIMSQAAGRGLISLIGRAFIGVGLVLAAYDLYTAVHSACQGSN